METKETNFFDMDRIPVQLTYLFTTPATVITFFCKMALADDDRDARQKFYSQSEAEQAAGLHAYYVDLLSRITAAKPDGLPGFDAFLTEGITKTDPPTPITLALTKARLGEFLSEPSDMKKKVVADAIELYNRVAQPVEFFR